MEHLLVDFIEKADADPRIDRTHLSLYLALFVIWYQQGYPCPIQLYSYQVMPKAKISSVSTYHGAILDLRAYGYIEYKPSNYKGRASDVFILKENVKDGNRSNNKGRS